MITVADIQSSEQLIDDLAWPFDFDIGCRDDDTEWIKLSPETPFVIVAGEGTGGVFLAYGDGDTKFS